MKKRIHIVTLLTLICLAFAGCSANSSYDPEYVYSAPRLVIRGTVSNEDGQALAGIRVSETNVLDSAETETITYNYALTDTSGKYTIIRYRGREFPTEVCVVATDPNGLYKQATYWAPVEYDTVITHNGKEPYNGFVTADFVLTKQ